jgi:hypothetical protein
MAVTTAVRGVLQIAGGSAAGAILLMLSSTAFAQQCPPPTPSISSSTLPTDVSNQVLQCDNGINFFDDFSWRSFVALIWPAANGQRGVPDTGQSNFPVNMPLVFETYKADWESFPPPGSPNPPPAPSPWSSFAGTANPCGASVNAGWGDLLLSSYSKFGNLGLADFGPFFVGPVIASGFAQSPSQQSYLRYQASYNKTEHDQIVGNKWYLHSKLGNVTFCSNGATIGGQQCPAENSIDLKSAWMDMGSVPDNLRSRYYIKKAWVLDPASSPANPQCIQRDMGLVGLHIVSKTPTRPQWIWSTFEQIDNVPPVVGATPTTNTVFNLNDGKGAAMPGADPYCVPQPGNPNVVCPGTPPPPAAMPADASQATRFNVTRTQRIGTPPMDGGPDSTPATNSAYQKLLAAAAPNSPWQYYQLVMTQWPAPGSKPSNPGTPNFTIPGSPLTTKVLSSFANVTMETFDQGAVFSGCMNCHNLTAHPNGASSPGNDFLWSLAVNAYPDVAPAPAAAMQAAKGRARFNPALHASSMAAFKALNELQRGALVQNSRAKAKAPAPPRP